MSLLGIDIGSSSIKVITINEDGEMIFNSHLENYFIFPKHGWIELDVKLLISKVFNIIKAINSSQAVKKDPITAVSFSTIGESFAPLDKNGINLYNFIYFTDNRSIREFELVFSKITPEELYYLCGRPPTASETLSRLLWLKNSHPELYIKTKKIMFIEDLLQHKLGIDNTKINYSFCATTLFFDIKEKKWSSKILDLFELDESLFSIPVPSGVMVGEICGVIAKELGFKKKVTVVTGAHDQTCASFGAGAVKNGDIINGMGSSETLNIALNDLSINEKIIKNKFQFENYIDNDMYIAIIGNLTSGSIIKWFDSLFLNKEKERLKEKRKDFYYTLFSKINFEPSNLFVLPNFFNTKSFNHSQFILGTITGLGLDTKIEDISKAIIEGLVFEIARKFEAIKKMGWKIGDIRVVGGGARSDYWLKLKSSILKKVIKRMRIIDSSCFAAAIISGIGTGKFKSEEAMSCFVKVDREFYPDKNIHDRYIKSFKMFKRIYKRISSLT